MAVTPSKKLSALRQTRTTSIEPIRKSNNQASSRKLNNLSISPKAYDMDSDGMVHLPPGAYRGEMANSQVASDYMVNYMKP